MDTVEGRFPPVARESAVDKSAPAKVGGAARSRSGRGLPCKQTFHHIPNLTSPLGLSTGHDGASLLRRGHLVFRAAKNKMATTAMCRAGCAGAKPPASPARRFCTDPESEGQTEQRPRQVRGAGSGRPASVKP